jgi:hypothetical protein
MDVLNAGAGNDTIVINARAYFEFLPRVTKFMVSVSVLPKMT